MVERYLQGKIDGLGKDLSNMECDVAEIRKAVDGHIDKLWTEVRAGHAKLSEILSEHAAQDLKALHSVETQLMQRVPSWALTIMTVGGAMIGAMSMYILDHLVK